MARWTIVLLFAITILSSVSYSQTHISPALDTNNSATGPFGAFTGLNQFQSGAILGPTTFAGLSAGNFVSAANGTLAFVTDATASNPCVGGGSGALAVRSGGAWTCLPTSISPPGMIIVATPNCSANDDVCMNNALNANSTNAAFYLPASTYTLNNPFVATNVFSLKIGCSENTTIAGAAGYASGGAANKNLFLLQGDIHDVILDGPCKWDSTNLKNTANNAAGIELSDYVMNVTLTQGAGNPSPCPTSPSTLICATVTSGAVPNFANINTDGDVLVTVWNSNPGDWNSAADINGGPTGLANSGGCDGLKCPVTRKGPITFYDSTHFSYAQDEHGNVNAVMPAYIAGALASIGPWKRIEINNVEVFSSPREGIYVHCNAPFPCVEDAKVSFAKLHDNGTAGANNGLRAQKTIRMQFIHNLCSMPVKPMSCYLGNSDMASVIEDNVVHKAWGAPNTQVFPSSSFRSGFGVGTVMKNNSVDGGAGRYCGSSFWPDFYFDTELNGQMIGNTSRLGSQGFMSEVGQGNRIEGNTSVEAGCDAFVNRYRADDWAIWDGNNSGGLFVQESHTVGQAGFQITTFPPVTGQTCGGPCATLTVGSATSPSGSNNRNGDTLHAMKVVAAASTPAGSLLWCIDVPETDGPTSRTTAGNTTGCNGSQCTVTYTGGASAFTTIPANGGIGNTNTVTLTGASGGDASINGTHTLIATGTHTITFTSSLNGNFVDGGITIQANTILPLYAYPRRLSFIDSLASDSGSATVKAQTLALVGSSSLGCLNPEQVIMIPSFVQKSGSNWEPQKVLFDPDFGTKTQGMQSWGMICVAQSSGAPNCNNVTFDVAGLEFDIFDNESISYVNNIATRPARTGFRTDGGHNIKYVGNDVYDAGFSHPSNYTGSGIYAGTAFLLDASDSTNTGFNSPATPIDRVTFENNHVYTEYSSLINQPNIAALRGDCSHYTGGTTGKPISNIFMGLNGIMVNDYFAGNAIQLPANCGDSTITGVTGFVTGNSIIGSTWTTSLTAAATPSGTVFLTLNCAGTTYAACSNGTETLAQSVMTRSGTVNALYAHVSAANGAGQTIALTVSKNASLQSVTCTIGNAGTTCNDIAHNFSFVAGDLLTVQMVDAGTSTSAALTVAVGYF